MEDDERDKGPILHGSGSIAEAVDRLLDGSTRYCTAVHAAFVRFQRPDSSTVPEEHLLPALRYFVEALAAEVDPKAGKIFFRPVTQEDVQAVLETLPALAVDSPIDLELFEQFTRRVVKRVALERGKRLGLFMLGGILLVHVAKGTLKNLPFIGGPLGCFADVLLPTTLLGPAVGIAGAIYL